jgi:hypothetical protein
MYHTQPSINTEHLVKADYAKANISKAMKEEVEVYRVLDEWRNLRPGNYIVVKRNGELMKLASLGDDTIAFPLDENYLLLNNHGKRIGKKLLEFK